MANRITRERIRNIHDMRAAEYDPKDLRNYLDQISSSVEVQKQVPLSELPLNVE